ncbi:hypothetical protein MNBD_GAMMA06-85 [hydrothermal vent metagenome]|uniref:Uncharacterized protein n=1 Tax=hydrothermal vent metagenome TaxID=652676 RepID=A0A3B0WGW6_9ZZZZ
MIFPVNMLQAMNQPALYWSLKHAHTTNAHGKIPIIQICQLQECIYGVFSMMSILSFQFTSV